MYVYFLLVLSIYKDSVSCEMPNLYVGGMLSTCHRTLARSSQWVGLFWFYRF